MNSKNIIIVGCYITTDDNKKVLINYINKLKKTGNDILLVSHSPIDDQDILNLVNYYIYDYDNFLLPKEKVPVTWFADDFEYINLYSCMHMYAITKNIYTSLNFCNLNDYKYFIYTEYDYILDDQDISKISDVFDQLEKNDKKLFFGNPHNYTHYQTQFFAGEIDFFIKNIPLVKTYDEWCTIYPYSLGNLPLEQSIALAAKDFIDKTIFVSSIADYFSNSDTDVYSIYDHRYPIIYNLENKYLPLLFFISKGGNYLIKIDEKVILNRYSPKGERINIKFCLRNNPVDIKVYYDERIVIDKIITLDNIENFRNFAERGLIDSEKYSYKNTIPIVVLCHNNEFYIDNTIKQLKKYHNNFIIIDNGSDDVDTINYLNDIQQTYKVIKLDANYQPFVVVTKVYDQMPDYFCFTDPDLEFNENLPKNFIENLIEISHKHNVSKVGFALKISDYESMYQDKVNLYDKTIYEWESQFWQSKIEDSSYELYDANIDTTFALYNKHIENLNYNNFYSSKKIRVAGNFECKHLPWYPEFINKLDINLIKKIYKNTALSTMSGIINKNYIK